MKGPAIAALLMMFGVTVGAQTDPALPIAIASRVLPDGSRSLLIDVRQLSRPADETSRIARISAYRFARRPFSERDASACDQIAF